MNRPLPQALPAEPPLAKAARLDAALECKWFFGCHNEPTHLQEHPAFPEGVPTCDTCKLFIDGNV